MKKGSLIILALLSATIVQAQLKYNKLYGRAGININRLTSSTDNDSTTYRGGAGPHFGIAMDFELEPKLYFQPEFLISKKLVKSQNEFVRARYSATYIDIPLLLRYHLSPNFSLLGGLQIGLLAGGNQQKNIVLPNAPEKFVEEKITDLSGSDVPFLIGIDWRLENEFHLGLRVGSSSGDVTLNDTKTVRMNMFQFTMSYLWQTWQPPTEG